MSSKFTDLLYSAVSATFGVEVRTNSPHNLRQQLYRAIREAKLSGNQDFNSLKFALSPVDPKTYLWIYHGTEKKVDRTNEENRVSDSSKPRDEDSLVIPAGS